MLVPRRVKIAVILFQASPSELFLASISKTSKILPDSHRLHDRVAAFCRSTSKAEVGRKGETQSEPMQVDFFQKKYDSRVKRWVKSPTSYISLRTSTHQKLTDGFWLLFRFSSEFFILQRWSKMILIEAVSCYAGNTTRSHGIGCQQGLFWMQVPTTARTFSKALKEGEMGVSEMEKPQIMLSWF